MMTVVDPLCPCVNVILEADLSAKSGEGTVDVVLLVVV
jgi:hypothetical protein